MTHSNEDNDLMTHSNEDNDLMTHSNEDNDLMTHSNEDNDLMTHGNEDNDLMTHSNEDNDLMTQPNAHNDSKLNNYDYSLDNKDLNHLHWRRLAALPRASTYLTSSSRLDAFSRARRTCVCESMA